MIDHERKPAEDYVRTHYADYCAWNSLDARRFLRYQWILQIGFCLFTLNNAWKGVGPWHHVPSMLLLMSIGPLSHLCKHRFPEATAWLWDVFSLSVVTSGILMYKSYHSLYGVGSENAPVFVTMLLASSFSLHPKARTAIYRNGIFMLFGLCVAAFKLDVQVFPILVQFAEGACVGSFIANYMVKSRRMRFYNLALNQELRIFAYHELAKIVPPHVVTHIESGRSLETSMLTGKASACVISFDIIGSSKVQHPDFGQAIERLAIACHALMNQGYDGQSAPAYRIKDTGDGFLCSVGFPYLPLDSKGSAEQAVELSLAFAECFREVMAELAYETPLRCAIGISQGLVEGFFPASGLKQYDLRGRTLMLATRYESLRNNIMRELGPAAPPSSFLIIQEAVYQNLPKHLQESFRCWDTSTTQRQVRDDETARCAYYRCLPCAVRSSVDLFGVPLLLEERDHASRLQPVIVTKTSRS